MFNYKFLAALLFSAFIFESAFAVNEDENTTLSTATSSEKTINALSVTASAKSINLTTLQNLREIGDDAINGSINGTLQTVPNPPLALTIADSQDDKSLSMVITETLATEEGFKFTFTNNEGNVSGSVSGVIQGLVDNENNQQASAVIITSWPDAATGSIPTIRDATKWNTQINNSFDVVDGKIVNLTFAAIDDSANASVLVLNTTMATTCCGSLNNALTLDNRELVIGNNSGFAALSLDLLLAPIEFYFTNKLGNVAGAVRGIISGLVNNKNDQSAVSVVITSWPAGLAGNVPDNLDVTTWTIASVNNFDVANGEIVALTVGGQEPGYGFYLDAPVSTNCCGSLNNFLSFDGSVTTTGNADGFPGVSLITVLPPFKFSFSNLEGNVSGSVSGEIRGLVDNQNDQRATSVIITKWPAGLAGNIPENLDVTTWATENANDFDVANGEIVSINFGYQGPGHFFNLDLTRPTNCCAILTNALSFDDGNTATGNNSRIGGSAIVGKILPPIRFSFQNQGGNKAGTVSGIIRGLVDNRNNQTALSVTLTSWPDDLLGNSDDVNKDATTWPLAKINDFDVSNGTITDMSFSGQIDGEVFIGRPLIATLALNVGVLSSCCNTLRNVLSFDRTNTSTGSTNGFSALSIKPVLSLSAGEAAPIISGISDAEKAALRSIYSATQGDNWTTNTGWLETGVDECDWFGVSCENNSVTGINLSSNQLGGFLPSGLGDLSNLAFLELHENEISGNIPVAVGKLVNLEFMNLRGNDLTGVLPDDLGELSNITALLVNNNRLSGAVPATLGNLGKLQILNLSNNDFSGNLPDSVLALNIPNLSFDSAITAATLETISTEDGFKFSFNNTDGNADTTVNNIVQGPVIGVIKGLVNNKSNQQASAVILTSWPDSLLGSFPEDLDTTQWSSQIENNFEVRNGKIVSASFAAQDDGGSLRTLVLNTGLQTSCCNTLNNALTLNNGETIAGNAGGFDALSLDLILPPFKFSFTNKEGNVIGIVTGSISGLIDNQNSQSALIISLNTFPAGLQGDIPDLNLTQWSDPITNRFDVVNGEITGGFFRAFDDLNSEFALNALMEPSCCNDLNSGLTFDAGQTITGNADGFDGVSIVKTLPPFTFSFDNIEGNTAGTVTGIISGLEDNQNNQSALSVILTDWPDDLAGTVPDNLDVTTWKTDNINNFDVENGQIVDIFFGGQEPGNAMFLNASLQNNCCGVMNNFLSFDSTNSSTGNNGGFSGISFSQTFATKPQISTSILTSISSSIQLTKVIATKGNTTTARFSAGASSDTGISTGSKFSADDDLVVAASAFPQDVDLGKSADIFVVLQTIIGGVRTFYYRDLDGNFQLWSGRARDLDAAYESDSLKSQESFSVYEGKLEAGIYRVYIAYMSQDNNFLHFNSKGLRIEIAE